MILGSIETIQLQIFPPVIQYSVCTGSHDLKDPLQCILYWDHLKIYARKTEFLKPRVR